jgi:aryl-phospho-beta-D-glucosidase BglC (GH1 family)
MSINFDTINDSIPNHRYNYDGLDPITKQVIDYTAWVFLVLDLIMTYSYLGLL